MQVERDHRTGATIIRSVSPVSSPADTPMATTVFDDGRKSIHAVGGAGDQPSTEELGQILDVIEGVGMKVLLDEVTVETKKEETKVENVDADSPPQGETLSLPASHAMPEEDNIHLDSSTSFNFEAELGIEDGAEGMENKEDKEEDRSVMEVKDIVGEVYKVEDQPSNEGPVSLVFLGYTESTTDQSHDQDNDEGMLTVERVMITEEGEEHVIEPEMSVSPEAEKESEDQVFQDIPLEGNGAAVDKVEVEEDDKGLHSSSLPSIADAGGESKRKTCQCCSVM